MTRIYQDYSAGTSPAPSVMLDNVDPGSIDYRAAFARGADSAGEWVDMYEFKKLWSGSIQLIYPPVVRRCYLKKHA